MAIGKVVIYLQVRVPPAHRIGRPRSSANRGGPGGLSMGYPACVMNGQGRPTVERGACACRGGPAAERSGTGPGGSARQLAATVEMPTAERQLQVSRIHRDVPTAGHPNPDLAGVLHRELRAPQ